MADATTPPAPTSSAPAGDWQAAIAYLSILFLYTAWAKSDSPTHMWHAKNGAGLFVVYLGIYILMNILVTVLPASMAAILGLIMSVINLLLLLVTLWGAWNAWKGKQWTIPVVTMIGQKIPLEKWFHKSSAQPSMQPSAPASTASETTTQPTTPVSSVVTPSEPVAPAAPVAPSTPIQPTAPTTPSAPSEPTPPTPPQTPAA